MEENALSPEVLGLAMSLSPFGDKISPNRCGMFATSLSQYQLLPNGESPNIFTGYEQYIPDYEHNLSEIEEDFVIIDIVPKLSGITVNGKPIFNFNRSFYVLGRHIDKGELEYYELKGFHKLQEGYGYSTREVNRDLIQIDNILPKGSKLYTSKANKIETGEYCFGINANVAFASLINTVEDAFLISDELAEKLTPEGFSTKKIYLNILSKNHFPINLLDSEEEVKIFPDIGEKVNDSGILCAFMEYDPSMCVGNFIKHVNKVNHLLDLVFHAEKGGEIVDVDVTIKPQIIDKLDPSLYNQIIQYHHAKLNSYRSLIEFYSKYSKNYSIGKKLNTLITNAAKYLSLFDKEFIQKKLKIRGLKTLPLKGDIEDADILLSITVKYKKPVNLGFKLTGRDGAKGVIGTILPKEHMLKDENGFQADIVIDPVSVIARNNPSQLFEAYINRIGDIVLEDTLHMSTNDGINHILGFIEKINPDQRKILEEELITQSDKKEYLNYSYKNGLKINITPSLPYNVDEDLIKLLADTYNVNISRATYCVNHNGTIKEIKTKKACCIGKKFIYLVYNEPEISAVNIGHINIFNSPTTVSSKSKNNSSFIKQNCVRFGEDEFRILLTTLGPEMTVRLREISNGLKGLECAIDTIVNSSKPTDINLPIHTKEMLDSDTFLSVIHTLCNAFGLDLINIIAKPKDYDYYLKAMSACIEDLKDNEPLDPDIETEETCQFIR